jgi:hypothetical protein
MGEILTDIYEEMVQSVEIKQPWQKRTMNTAAFPFWYKQAVSPPIKEIMLKYRLSAFYDLVWFPQKLKEIGKYKVTVENGTVYVEVWSSKHFFFWLRRIWLGFFFCYTMVVVAGGSGGSFLYAILNHIGVIIVVTATIMMTVV